MSFTMFDDLWQSAKELPRRQGEQLLYAVTAYAIDGEEPGLTGELGRLFRAYRYRLDASVAASAKGRAMAAARYAKQERQQDAAADAAAPAAADATARAAADMLRVGKDRKEKGRGDSGGAPAPKRFAPPTAEDVRAYSEEQGLGIDPERFVDYYAAQGWKLKNGRDMRDWRAAARNWARRDGTAKAGAPAREDRFSHFDRLRVVGGDA